MLHKPSLYVWLEISVIPAMTHPCVCCTHTDTQSFQMIIRFPSLLSENPCLFAAIHCSSSSVFPLYNSLFLLLCTLCVLSFTFPNTHCLSYIVPCHQCLSVGLWLGATMFSSDHPSSSGCSKDTRHPVLPHTVSSHQCREVGYRS